MKSRLTLALITFVQGPIVTEHTTVEMGDKGFSF